MGKADLLGSTLQLRHWQMEAHPQPITVLSHGLRSPAFQISYIRHQPAPVSPRATIAAYVLWLRVKTSRKELTIEQQPTSERTEGGGPGALSEDCFLKVGYSEVRG